MEIKREVKKHGGSLTFVIGYHECKSQNIEEGDTVVTEIKEVIKKGKKKK